MGAAVVVVLVITYFGTGVYLGHRAVTRFSQFNMDFMIRASEFKHACTSFLSAHERYPTSWDELLWHDPTLDVEAIRSSIAFDVEDMVVNWSAMGHTDDIVAVQPELIYELHPMFGGFERRSIEMTIQKRQVLTGNLEVELVEPASPVVTFK